VVEVAFTAVEANGRYEAGLALSSPRILRLRNDKEPAEADSVATLRALCPPQQ
jgi:DNA ligase-1